jgi:hypothetical protein
MSFKIDILTQALFPQKKSQKANIPGFSCVIPTQIWQSALSDRRKKSNQAPKVYPLPNISNGHHI